MAPLINHNTTDHTHLTDEALPVECMCTRKYVEALREEPTVADLTLCVGVDDHTSEERGGRGWREREGRERERRGRGEREGRGKREGEERGKRKKRGEYR